MACPACRSEEVYPFRANGEFATRKRERGLLVQRLVCERCLHRFLRPGRLFATPTAPLRPADLYD